MDGKDNKKPTGSATILDLPTELMVQILSDVAAQDITNSALTCRRMYNVLQDKGNIQDIYRTLSKRTEERLKLEHRRLISYSTDTPFLIALTDFLAVNGMHADEELRRDVIQRFAEQWTTVHFPPPTDPLGTDEILVELDEALRAEMEHETENFALVLVDLYMQNHRADVRERFHTLAQDRIKWSRFQELARVFGFSGTDGDRHLQEMFDAVVHRDAFAKAVVHLEEDDGMAGPRQLGPIKVSLDTALGIEVENFESSPCMYAVRSSDAMRWVLSGEPLNTMKRARILEELHIC